MACMIDQDPPDYLCAQGKEAGPVLTLDPLRTQQLEINLVREGGRFHGLTRRPARQMLPGNAPQFGIYHRDELVQGLIVAVTPGREEPADIFGTTAGHDGYGV